MSVLETLHQEHKERRARLWNDGSIPNKPAPPPTRPITPDPIPPEPPLMGETSPYLPARIRCPDCGGTGFQLLEPLPVEKFPTMREITKCVSITRGVAVRNLLAQRRDRRVSKPRCELMWLAYELTPHSFPSIGKYLQRDHTTIMSGRSTTQARMDADPAYAAEINAMRDELLRSVGL